MISSLRLRSPEWCSNFTSHSVIALRSQWPTQQWSESFQLKPSFRACNSFHCQCPLKWSKITRKPIKLRKCITLMGLWRCTAMLGNDVPWSLKVNTLTSPVAVGKIRSISERGKVKGCPKQKDPEVRNKFLIKNPVEKTKRASKSLDFESWRRWLNIDRADRWADFD